ncbi:glycosyl hydrolase 53 family protein [Bdellovibrio sp. HCB2-146]|uniref:glycosyl hydrolase 53 family protein n=1 Tax=Bdellovibrio sp. HCB2-146 TaxID=3394362 RepID=UPI0039BD092D
MTQSKILWGVNGHDIRAVYPLTQSETNFKMLSEKGLRTYRVDVTWTNTIILDTLIPLSKKYSIKLRPMFYPMTQEQAYNIAKKYGRDLEIIEIGNEQNLEGRTGAQDRINAMMATYRGIKQAATELGINIKTSINVTNCNSDDLGGRCGGDRNGDMWFLDMAKASGFNFDVITFHYYPWYGNKGYWFDMYLGQMRAMATKYNVPIYLNETHCAEIYRGNQDGGYPGDKGCYDSMNEFFQEVTTKYSDIVQEINMYELFDEPYQAHLDPVGAEAHFGLMYDINRPKEILNLLVNWAKKVIQ